MNPTNLSRRQVLAISGLGLTGLGTAGCAKEEAGGAATKLGYWNSYATSSSTDKAKKREDFWITQAISRFQDSQHVTIDVTDPPGGVETLTKFRAAGIARNGPDVALLWSGAYFLGVKDFLEPLDDLLTDEDKTRLTGWEAVTEGFEVGKGTTYGVPTNNGGVCVLYFDKRALDKAGVTVGAEGLDWDTWLDHLDRMKATGVTPLALGTYEYSLFSLTYWMAQVAGGNAGVRDLGSGARKFSDPALEDVVTKWLQLIKYCLPGAPTMTDATNRFIAGKAAGTIALAGGIPELRKTFGDNLVMTTLPDISSTAPVKNSGIGGGGGALVVSNYSKNKDASLEFIKYLVSEDEQKKRLENGELTPIPNIVGLDPTTINKDPLYQEQYRLSNAETIYWPDNIWPTALVSELLAQAQLTWGGKLSPQDFLTRLDKKRDQIVAER